MRVKDNFPLIVVSATHEEDNGPVKRGLQVENNSAFAAIACGIPDIELKTMPVLFLLE